MNNRIVLGTAQFGLNYGINNQGGKIPRDEAFTILDTAVKYEISTLDTAYSYGDSEEVIGEFFQTHSQNLNIISKLPVCNEKEIVEILKTSLRRLGLSKIYGYLIHNFKNYTENPLMWEELVTLKQKGYIEKVGFSLYYPSELEILFKNNLEVDIIQVPFNIFDQRFEPYFEEIKRRRIELYIRSVFLQGLVFKRIDNLSVFFNPIKDRLQQLNLISEKNNIPVLGLCLTFVLGNKFIDKVVVGVDSLSHFNEIIQTLNNFMIDTGIFFHLKQLKFDNEKIILPFNWPDIGV